ncbi:FkbM family methyltransferase [Mycolicibacterium sp. BK556]|uniref:FkbM family methyltransferase n=1 Tax=unclassified Mycolicibacterium TaxID=2636767 RepID=UPI00161A507F|nr:FkbM family methyltransferase [Mycolicibacterium sp. BK556]MBB3635382.1 FkbM family methyltransferase [Mycolicibacterium sp. BK607]
MALKHAVYDAVNRPSTRWLLGLAASANATLAGDRALFTYDRQTGDWLKRTRAGAMLLPDLRGGEGMDAAQCDAFAREVFLPEYTIRPGDVVLDVGAGIGTEALPFSRMVGDSGRVIAIEAHPTTYAKLARVCQANNLRNVEPIHAAVMDTEGTVKITDLQAESYLENKIGDEGVPVAAVTIPGLVAKLKLDRIDFLKMNIEGAELPALRGALDVLPIVRHAAIGCHDFLADETGDESYRTKDAVHAILVDAGFTVTSRSDDPRPWAAGYLFASR